MKWLREIRVEVTAQWVSTGRNSGHYVPVSPDDILDIIIRERQNGFKFAVNNQAAVDLYKERGILPEDFKR